MNSFLHDIPIWRVIIGVALIGYLLLGQDVRSETKQNSEDIVELKQIDAGAIQFRLDTTRRLQRIENTLDELNDQKPDVAPLEPGTDLSPIMRQLNRMEEQQQRQEQEINSIRRYLSPRRN